MSALEFSPTFVFKLRRRLADSSEPELLHTGFSASEPQSRLGLVPGVPVWRPFVAGCVGLADSGCPFVSTEL